jgi:hypothetical protein
MYGTSNYLEEKLLKHIVLNQSFPAPTGGLSVALTKSVVHPNQTGASINEVNGPGYNRVQINTLANSAAKWQYYPESHKSDLGPIRNKTNIVFPTPTGDWGTISGIAIVDSNIPGQGNVLFFKELDPPRIIYAGETVKFNPGNLGLSIE